CARVRMGCGRRRDRPSPAPACCPPTAPVPGGAACPLFSRPKRRSRGRSRPPPERSSGHRLDRIDDVLVAGAAADVALERMPNLVFARLRVLLEEAHGGEHHATRAVATLERVVLVKALLQPMEGSVLGQTLDRADLVPV